MILQMASCSAFFFATLSTFIWFATPVKQASSQEALDLTHDSQANAAAAHNTSDSDLSDQETETQQQYEQIIDLLCGLCKRKSKIKVLFFKHFNILILLGNSLINITLGSFFSLLANNIDEA